MRSEDPEETQNLGPPPVRKSPVDPEATIDPETRIDPGATVESLKEPSKPSFSTDPTMALSPPDTETNHDLGSVQAADSWATIAPQTHGSLPKNPDDPFTTRSNKQDLKSDDAPNEGWLGEYKLIRLLGQGGMGSVYLAEKASLGRRVALKIISGGRFSNSLEITRFRGEAEAAGSLEHPGIATVYDVGFEDGQHYYSMRYVDGLPLSRIIQDSTAIDMKRAVRWILQISQAMQFAHENGVVHRDLKPGNIMVDRSGNSMVVDFGLAKRMSSESDMTTTGQVMGTPAYMAPEQAMGLSKKVGPAADVYSIGAIFYELLTGRKPFVADSLLELLNKVRTTPAEPPRNINRKIPLDLQTICLKCLEKDPRHRYGSAGEIAEELQLYTDFLPIKARRISAPQRLMRWCGRNRLLAGFLFSLSFATLILGWMAIQLTIESSNSLKSFRKQVSTINELMVRVSEDELSDVPNAFLVRRNILMKAKDYYEEATSSRNFPGMNDFKTQVDSYYAGILAEVAQTDREQEEAVRRLKGAELQLRTILRDQSRASQLEPIIEAYCSGSQESDRWRKSMLPPKVKIYAIRSEALSRNLRDQLVFSSKHGSLPAADRLELARQIVQLRESTYDSDPSDIESARLLASALHNLASMELDLVKQSLQSGIGDWFTLLGSSLKSIDRAQSLRRKIESNEIPRSEIQSSEAMKSIVIERELARGHYMRALILEAGVSQVEGASAENLAAWEITSSDPSPWTRKEVIDEYETAIQFCRRILEVNPRHTEATKLLSLSLMQQAFLMEETVAKEQKDEILEKYREAHRRLRDLSFKNDLIASYAVDYASAANFLAIAESASEDERSLSDALRVVVDASKHCEEIASRGDSEYIVYRTYLAVIDIAGLSTTVPEFIETKQRYLDKAQAWLKLHPNSEDEADLKRILEPEPIE